MNNRENLPGTVRVRFAPSPTGYLHLGGARTALYNWIWARKTNGVFILRIEDTDAERSTEESVEEILQGLAWLGLDWDEGPIFQSDNVTKHVAAAEKMLASGHAYRCFCSREDLEQQRKDAEAKKVAFMYDGRCRTLGEDVLKDNLKRGVPFVTRFLVPREPLRSVFFEDEVYGRVERKAQDIEDFVIVRSDGRPLYILSNAIDDAEDSITHVIRGADGIANTPKQILIYEALGISPPIFAHMPLTLDNKRAKLSKRSHGEVVTVSYYRRNGFLPWALCNFLALLGWSSPDGREFFSRQELIDIFELNRINRANSIFNYVPGDSKNWTDPKAIHFNATYIRTMPLDELVPYVKEELQREGLWKQSFDEDDRAWFTRTIDLIRARFHTLKDFSTKGRCYFSDEFVFEQKAVAKNLYKDPSLSSLLPELAAEIAREEEFSASAVERVLRGLAESRQIPAGLLINATRTAVSGTSVGPGLFEMLELIGKETIVQRLIKAGEMIRVKGSDQEGLGQA